MGFKGVGFPARSIEVEPTGVSGGEAESFETIIHLKGGPKLVKTLMQSKYCAVTNLRSMESCRVHGAQPPHWGPARPD